MKDMEDEDFAESKAETKLSIIMIFSIVALLIFIIAIVRIIISNLSTQYYYILNIDEQNKGKVIELLKKEKKDYCASMYKIELQQLFPDDKSGKIYCKNEENINFIVMDNGFESSELSEYIFSNGNRKKR